MPPCFMRSISFASSRLSTAGPNHHQRIIMRESSGGCRNIRSTSGMPEFEVESDFACDHAGTASAPQQASTAATRLETCTNVPADFNFPPVLSFDTTNKSSCLIHTCDLYIEDNLFVRFTRAQGGECEGVSRVGHGFSASTSTSKT